MHLLICIRDLIHTGITFNILMSGGNVCCLYMFRCLEGSYIGTAETVPFVNVWHMCMHLETASVSLEFRPNVITIKAYKQLTFTDLIQTVSNDSYIDKSGCL